MRKIRNDENPDALVGQHLPETVQARRSWHRRAGRLPAAPAGSPSPRAQPGRALAGRSGRNHNTATPSSTDGTPSSRNIHCQPCSAPSKPSSQPDSGPPITLAAGTAARNRAMNRARVACGKPVGHIEDHAGIKPGLRQRPAESAAHKRRTRSVTKAVAIETRPQVSMMRHIQTRAPTFSSIRLEGTSKRK